MTQKRSNKSGKIVEVLEPTHHDPESLVAPAPVKKNNFPAGKNRNVKTKIIPAHREILKHYEEQKFRNLGKAVRKTGMYSEQVAQRVHNITNTKSWQALMQEYMPEEHIAKRHAEILDKRDYRKVIHEDGTVEEVDDGPNTAAVTKGLELAYKLRGSFKEKKETPTNTKIYNLIYRPEVREQMEQFEQGIKNTLMKDVARKNQKDIADEEGTEVEAREIGSVDEGGSEAGGGDSERDER